MSWKSRRPGTSGRQHPRASGRGAGATKAQGWTLGGDATQDRGRGTNALASLLRSPDARWCLPRAKPDGKPAGGEPGKLDLWGSRWAAGMAAGWTGGAQPQLWKQPATVLPCHPSSAPARGVPADSRLSPPAAWPSPASISLFLALSRPRRGGGPLRRGGACPLPPGGTPSSAAPSVLYF